MKAPRKIISLLAGLTLAIVPQPAAADIVGYVNHTFQSGYSLFGNPLNAPNNNLSSIIPTAPAGAVVSLWDYALQQYTPTATFNGTSWNTDFVLAPGTGAQMYAPSTFANTYTGTVLDANGSPYDGSTVHLPPAFPPLTGYYLASSRIPFSGSAFGGYKLFELIFGRPPEDDTQFIRFDTATQTFTQSLIAVGGDFYTQDFSTLVDPVLNIGEAGFFYIGGGSGPIIPEPGSMALVGMSFSVMFFARRRK